MVPNYPLLFFGEKLNYSAPEGIINVDGFVRVRSSSHVAHLVQVSLKFLVTEGENGGGYTHVANSP